MFHGCCLSLFISWKILYGCDMKSRNVRNYYMIKQKESNLSFANYMHSRLWHLFQMMNSIPSKVATEKMPLDKFMDNVKQFYASYFVTYWLPFWTLFWRLHKQCKGVIKRAPFRLFSNVPARNEFNNSTIL